MRKNNFKHKNRSLIIILILLSFILIFAVILINNPNSTKSSKTGGPNSGNTNSPGSIINTDQHKFSPENYEQIKLGMSQKQVQQLLNLHRPECSHTDTEPPNTICTWVDGDKSITVNFGTIDSVTAKYKTGF